MRFARYLFRVSTQVIRQWARDRCPQQAASLAFQTVLSIVPALAVALAALRVTGNMGAESSLVDFVAEKFIPVSPEQIADKLQTWSENVTFESLGLVGLITTVLLGFVMFNSLERIINEIWRVERKRSFAQKFVVFYASATIGPFLIGVSLYQAAKVGLADGYGGFLLSIVTSFFALFLANYFLPATKVRVGPALIGAAVTTVLFEVAKYAFSAYATQYAFQKYSGIYGTVAIVPLWLVWIYWSWLMLLLGVEVAHAAQNISVLERMDRRGAMSLENELVRRVNGVMAARVMVAVSESYIVGDKTLSRAALADRFDLSGDAVERLTQRLEDNDLLIEVEGHNPGFIPARPPDEITLDEVLATFRADDIEVPGAALSRARLEAVLREIDANTKAVTTQLTLADLARADD
jgi:membrane protein